MPGTKKGIEFVMIQVSGCSIVIDNTISQSTSRVVADRRSGTNVFSINCFLCTQYVASVMP